MGTGWKTGGLQCNKHFCNTKQGRSGSAGNAPDGRAGGFLWVQHHKVMDWNITKTD